MKIENIKKTLLRHKTDVEISTIINDEIYACVGVYGESYDCNIEIEDEQTISINFNNFLALNEIQNVVQALQQDNNDCFNVEFAENGYNNQWKYNISLIKYENTITISNESDWELSDSDDSKNFVKVFGYLSERVIWSNDYSLEENDIVTITNKNCKAKYDAINGKFSDELNYGYSVDLEVISTDLTNYCPENDDDVNSCAFAKCRVLKVVEEVY